MFVGSALMVMVLDLKLSVIFLIVIALITVTIYWIMSRSVPYYKVIQSKLDKVAMLTREHLEGVRIIRAFSKQDSEVERVEKANEDLFRISMRVGKIIYYKTSRIKVNLKVTNEKESQLTCQLALFSST